MTRDQAIAKLRQHFGPSATEVLIETAFELGSAELGCSDGKVYEVTYSPNFGLYSIFAS